MKGIMNFVFFLSIFSLNLSIDKIGLDISNLVSNDSFKCLKDDGYDHVIFRGYRRSGSVDPNFCQNVINALNVSFPALEDFFAYISPCVSCNNPADEVNQVYRELDDCAIPGFDPIINMILVVQGDGWSTKDVNRKFISTLIDTSISLETNCAILTSKYFWGNIVGLDFTYGSENCALYYINYNNDSSFDDFEPFGGWDWPEGKQYSQNVQECNVTFNMDTM